MNLNHEKVNKVAQVIEIALAKELEGQSLSLISLVVGTMTGLIRSLEKKEVSVKDILMVYQTSLTIFEQELRSQK